MQLPYKKHILLLVLVALRFDSNSSDVALEEPSAEIVTRLTSDANMNTFTNMIQVLHIVGDALISVMEQDSRVTARLGSAINSDANPSEGVTDQGLLVEIGSVASIDGTIKILPIRLRTPWGAVYLVGNNNLSTHQAQEITSKLFEDFDLEQFEGHDLSVGQSKFYKLVGFKNINADDAPELSFPATNAEIYPVSAEREHDALMDWSYLTHVWRQADPERYDILNALGFLRR